MAQRNLVLFNAKGGTAKRNPGLFDVVAEAARQHDPDVDVVACDPAEITVRARAAAIAGTRLVVACGGDGTISAVAGVLAGSHTALGVVPVGTLNHFARDLGLPVDPRAAIAVAFSAAERRVDIARVNGRPFINNCSLGLYPSLVEEREKVENEVGKLAGVAQAIGKVWQQFPTEIVKVSVDGAVEVEVETPLLFVGNNRYTLTAGGAGSRQRLDGGVLSLCVTVAGSQLALLGDLLQTYIVGPERAPGVEYFEARVVRVFTASPEVKAGIDGEATVLSSPLEFSIGHGALLVRA